MLFIAKLTITYPFHEKDQDIYKSIHNRFVVCAHLTGAQFGYDYEIERLDYYNGVVDFEIYRDVIYVYREIDYNRSFSSMAKFLEGCAEMTAFALDSQIGVEYLDELPIACALYRSPASDDYQKPEMIK